MQTHRRRATLHAATRPDTANTAKTLLTRLIDRLEPVPGVGGRFVLFLLPARLADDLAAWCAELEDLEDSFDREAEFDHLEPEAYL